MNREVKLLDESIRYLINISDVLDAKRKKFSSSKNTQEGQKALINAIVYFQKAKKELNKDDTSRGEE